MTTLLLTTDPGNGFIRLTITPTEDITRVRRSDANGTYDVRTLTGQLPYTGPDVLVLDDYEANGKSTYTVTTTAGTVSGSIILELPSPWLGTPEVPQYSAAVPSVLDYSAGASTLTTVFEPDGRYDPTVIVRGAGTRRGTLTVEAGTYPAALGILRLFQRGQTMFLRQSDHAGMDMFFIPMNFDIITARKAGKGSLFDVQCQYIEVGRPSGALSGALGWDWDSLAAGFGTWDDVFDAYATWGDVQTDRRKP